MRISRLLPFVAVAVLVSPALFAGDHLQQYKLWPTSPQGYYMTKAERATWNSTVRTDEQAEQFIKEFLARRPKTFVDDVAKRADMADKHLTVAGQLGSRTARGKLVILLGPPQSFTITRRETKGELSATQSAYQNAMGDTSSKGGVGITAQDMNDVSLRQDMSRSIVNDYTFTYSKDKLPGNPGKDLIVTVEVSPTEGTDKINDGKAVAQLESFYEAVAQASLATPAAK